MPGQVNASGVHVGDWHYGRVEGLPAFVAPDGDDYRVLYRPLWISTPLVHNRLTVVINWLRTTVWSMLGIACGGFRIEIGRECDTTLCQRLDIVFGKPREQP